MESPSIARLSLSCQAQFEILIEALENTNEDNVKRELYSSVIDELGRFRIWASNIGALSTGRASLDYRLRDAEYLHKNVASLLRDLKECLSEGFGHSPVLS